jgi:hypothetical protein
MDACTVVVRFGFGESSVVNVKFLAEREQTLSRVLTIFWLGSSAFNLDCFSRCDNCCCLDDCM